MHCLSWVFPAAPFSSDRIIKKFIVKADAMAYGGVGANDARILTEASIDALRANQMGTFVCDSEFSCATGPGYGYGLGVRTLIDKSQGQRSPLGEYGWDGANGAFLIVDPKNHQVCKVKI